MPDSKGSTTAVREFYRTPELLQRVLDLLDKKTLASLMALEKGATAAVAGALYKDIHVSLFRVMSRKHSRLRINCNAVRQLDLSPHPTLADTVRHYFTRPEGVSGFDPTTVLANLRPYQNKYPNLRKIVNLYPAGFGDDPYVVHIHESGILAEVHTTVDLELMPTSFILATPTLPASPIHAGMHIIDTVELRLFSESSYLSEAVRRRCVAWLFRNPELDIRVSGFGGVLSGFELNGVTAEDCISLCLNRRQSDCAPLQSLHISATTVFTLAEFEELCGVLGDHLRTLTLPGEVFHLYSDICTAFELLGRTVPALQELDIAPCPYNGGRLPFVEGQRASVLPMLRILSFQHRSAINDRPDLCPIICGIGSKYCVYVNTGFIGHGAQEGKFDLKCRGMKSRELQGVTE